MLSPTRKVRVAVNSFLADASGGFPTFAEGTDREPGPGDHEAMVRYFELYSPVSPPSLDRVAYRIP